MSSLRGKEESRNSLTPEQVVARVYALIREGELRPGNRLPPEREFAKQLGISRPSLRAGLRSLIAMGLVRSRQGVGTFVAEGPPTLESGPLILLSALHGFTIDQMFEARRVLEESVAALAAERANGEQLAALAEELAAMYGALEDPHEYLVHDIRFHRAIGAASSNPILATLVEMVSGVMYDRRRATIERAHDFKESMEMHHGIYRAIRARDAAQARATMHEHLVRAQRAYVAEESQHPEIR